VRTKFDKEKKILNDVARTLSAEPSVLKIVAYGSRVRGDFREDSDFDIFVLVDKKNPGLKNRIRDVFYEYEMKYNIPFSVTILSREEYDFNVSLGSPFVKSLQEEGIIIYDAQPGRKAVSLKIPA